MIASMTLPGCSGLGLYAFQLLCKSSFDVAQSSFAIDKRGVKEVSEETMDAKIQELATLIGKRNAVASRITAVVGRPALIGHVGEYIASRVFDIQLEQSAVSKGIDGVFGSGVLVGRTVNIKFYAKRENLLDIRPDAVADHYLVMTGPKASTTTSRGEVRPWHIDSVFLFDGPALVDRLKARNVKIGVATSVVTEQWNRAEVYPECVNSSYQLNNEQKEMLGLFCPSGGGV